MPELPEPKARLHPWKDESPSSLRRSVAPSLPRYVELAAASNFSFLRGGSHPEELVERAPECRTSGDTAAPDYSGEDFYGSGTQTQLVLIAASARDQCCSSKVMVRAASSALPWRSRAWPRP